MDEDELRFEEDENQEYREGEDELREYGWKCKQNNDL
jgi:hypothetical protein